MSNNYDVIVVGAGPGGATSAYELARAGLKTLLLEKERMPRYKPCGGGLSLKVQKTLGVDLGSVVENTITQASVAYGPDRLRINFRETIAWCVMRPKFDLMLAERAAAAGALVRDGTPVTGITWNEKGATVTTRGETLTARMIVGADGVNGIVRRAAGFPRHTRLAAAIEAEMEAPTRSIEEFYGTLHLDFGAIPWGYAWIFPKAEHLSVGIGALMRPGHPLDLRADLNRYLHSERVLENARETLTRGYRIPLGGLLGRYHGSHVVLVGDAAGLVDPFTAEGIYYAIRSGQIAAEEIARALQTGNFDLARYTQCINREMNSDFRFGWFLTQLFYRAPRLGYQIFKKSKRTQTAVSEMVNGEMTYKQLVWGGIRDFARSLLRPPSKLIKA